MGIASRGGSMAVDWEKRIDFGRLRADRLLRPGDQASFDIIHSLMGYRTCYYRTSCVGSANRAQLCGRVYVRGADVVDADRSLQVGA